MRNMIALTSYLGTKLWIRPDQIAQVEPAPSCESEAEKSIITRVCDGEEIYVQEEPEVVLNSIYEAQL